MRDTTKEAYEYARKMKKVNEGVIEAYNHAFEKGFKSGVNQPTVELLKVIQARYDTKKDIEYALGMSGSTRGINDQEAQNIKIRSLIDQFINDFEQELETLKGLNK